MCFQGLEGRQNSVEGGSLVLGLGTSVGFHYAFGGVWKFYVFS